MDPEDATSDAPAPSCCSPPGACVFSKALLSRQARCTLAERRSLGEQEVVMCPRPPARSNCAMLHEAMRERATFALRLPRSGAPLIHARALQLQCGGLHGLAEALGAESIDVHALVVAAQDRHGSLLDLPWPLIVAAMSRWTSHRARRTDTP